MMNSLGGEALDDVGIGCSKSFDGNGGSESEFCFGNQLNVFRRFEFDCVMRVRIWDQSPIRSRPHLVLAIYGPGQPLPCFPPVSRGHGSPSHVGQRNREAVDVAAWTGEKELASQQLETGLRAPDASLMLSYGALKL